MNSLKIEDFTIIIDTAIKSDRVWLVYRNFFVGLCKPNTIINPLIEYKLSDNMVLDSPSIKNPEPLVEAVYNFGFENIKERFLPEIKHEIMGVDDYTIFEDWDNAEKIMIWNDSVFFMTDPSEANQTIINLLNLQFSDPL